MRLSACVATLSPRSQRLLLLRAGIATGQPAGPAAVARRLGIRFAREGRAEHGALAGLRTAAREDRCGTIPAWVHVPASDRLVAFSPALSSASQPVRAVLPRAGGAGASSSG